MGDREMSEQEQQDLYRAMERAQDPAAVPALRRVGVADPAKGSGSVVKRLSTKVPRGRTAYSCTQHDDCVPHTPKPWCLKISPAIKTYSSLTKFVQAEPEQSLL